MRTMVTGGAGFIGSTLVDRLLAAGHEVDVIDDLSSGSLDNLAGARRTPGRKFSFHRFDVTDPTVIDLIARRRPDVVFHLAAQISVRVSLERPAHDAKINILGSLNVLEGARAASVGKIVFASSGGTIYGDPTEFPVGEGHRQHPISPYGVSKATVGNYLHYYREIHGLEYSALALANVYGPRQDPHGEAGVVAIFAGMLLGNKRPTIFGDGEQTRDFVFVDDVVDAFVRASDRGGGLLMNIGTGSETSVQELYAAMAAQVGYTEPARYGPQPPGELRRSALDPSRAGIHLGWEPFTSMQEGIRRTLDWFRAERAANRTR